MHHLKRSLHLIPLFAALLLTACATSGYNVWVDSSPQLGGTAYQTFAFAQPLGTDGDGYQSILSQRLMAATQRALEARGLRRVDSQPQLMVNFHILWVERSYVTPYVYPTFGYGWGRGYYGSRFGFYSSWPFYPSYGAVNTTLEGTLRIDINDERTRQRVWVALIDDFASSPDTIYPPGSVENAIHAAFEKFPLPVKASPQPPAAR